MTMPTSESAALIGSEGWRRYMIGKLALAVKAVSCRHRRPAKEKRLRSVNSRAVGVIEPQSPLRKETDIESLPN